MLSLLAIRVARVGRSGIPRLFAFVVVAGWASPLIAQIALPTILSIERGREMFHRKWEEGDEQTPAGDGLGPMFNARSCVDCHNQGGAGGSGSREKNVELLCLIPPQSKDKLDRQRFAGGVKKIHPALVTPASAVLPSITLHKFGTNPVYDGWRVTLLMLADALPQGEVPERLAMQVVQRRTPPLFGAGLIDAIPNDILVQTAQRQAKAHSDVKGKVARSSDGGAGKFGWRGQTATLKQFVMGACANELGLQVPLITQPMDPLEPTLKSPGLDLDQQQCNDLVAYVASLPAPKERKPSNRLEKEMWSAGAQVFKRVGCADCHVPKLGEVAGIYSDLLLHDMGPTLADPAGSNSITVGLRSSTGAYYGGPQDIFVDVPPESRRQWRTPPLWGLVHSAPYLHDGRAPTIEEAVLQHGGEATAAKVKYLALHNDARDKLVSYLQSVGYQEP